MTINSNDNLNVWNLVKQTPNDFLKKIEYGYLKGKSDINPQWRLMAMTQAFGVVGHGWTYRIVRTWSETGADGQVMAFSEVAVKTKINGEWGEEFFGTGGSTIVELAKGILKSNDEGYKMATTDALSVAFKAVGVAADIYLGNFDGSKYKREIDHAFQEDSSQSKPPQHQSQNSQQKPKDTRTQAQLYNDALTAIKDATETKILDAAMKRFKGTTYEAGITNACNARADMMGWQPSQPQQNNSMHH